MPDQLLTPAEVATVFGVSPRTVNRWIEAGRLVAVVLPSGRARVKRSDVEALLAPAEVTK